MVHRDRIKWNDKYLQHEALIAPSGIVTKNYALSRKGKALDIAAGTGRNAIFLAKHGFSVEAIDISDEGLRQFRGLFPDLHPLCADLDTFDIPPDRYALILNIRFLNRRLFPLIIEGLIHGGILIFESYLEKPGRNDGDPTCRDYLLRENELLHAFLSLKILYYREANIPGRENRGTLASLVAMKKE
jgi:tellurite methyltransferase